MTATENNLQTCLCLWNQRSISRLCPGDSRRTHSLVPGRRYCCYHGDWRRYSLSGIFWQRRPCVFLSRRRIAVAVVCLFSCGLLLRLMYSDGFKWCLHCSSVILLFSSGCFPRQQEFVGALYILSLSILLIFSLQAYCGIFIIIIIIISLSCIKVTV